jgi:hypothetical protein
MSLTADTKITRFGSPDLYEPISKPMGASVTLYRGSIAVTDGSGNLKNPATTAPSALDVVWGLISDASPGAIGFQGAGPGIVNSGAAGAVSCEIERGAFYLFGSAGADALTAQNLGTTVYLVNETTVSKNSLGGVRPAAGVLVNIDTSQAGGFAVQVGSAQSTGQP